MLGGHCGAIVALSVVRAGSAPDATNVIPSESRGESAGFVNLAPANIKRQDQKKDLPVLFDKDWEVERYDSPRTCEVI